MALTDIDAGRLADNVFNVTGANKNRIINGDMRIDQRNAGASVTPSNSYTLDRWTTYNSPASKFTVQQASDGPAGFQKSLKVTSSSAYTVAAGEFQGVLTKIEGYNIADLAWGTASAKTATLSFWVKSSLTGTFGGSLTNAGYARSYPFSYSISSANTWEYKTITIAGDTSGTWETTTSTGIELTFGLGVGSTYSAAAGTWVGSWIASATGATSVVGTNGATFYITGVQLEAGSVATPFEHRNYGQELQLCERYFQIHGSKTQADRAYAAGSMTLSTEVQCALQHRCEMRSSPTVTASGNHIARTGASALTATFSAGESSVYGTSLYFTCTGGTQGNGVYLRSGSGGGTVNLSAEL